MQQELVEDAFERFDGGNVHLDQKAVFSGDAMAFADLGYARGELGDLGQLAWAGPQPHPGATGKPIAAGSMSSR